MAREAVRSELANVEDRLDRVDTRLDGIDGRLDGMQGQLDELKLGQKEILRALCGAQIMNGKPQSGSQS